jgi:curved DNA-binding protein CbpA
MWRVSNLRLAMGTRGSDPYQVLGVNPGVSEDDLRSAYRKLVQRYHPDHNAGSPESARRFEEVQEAYAQIQRNRRATPAAGQAPPRPTADPAIDSRMADLERELRDAHLARERARKAAREAAANSAKRPSDEELGYVTTDDSFSKILADARREASDLFSKAREHPQATRIQDLIDELASKLTGERPPDSRG